MFHVEKFQTLRKGGFGGELYYFDEIDSTNRFAADLAHQNVNEGTVVLADSQTHGRGRNTHSWYSPAGSNLYFTVVLYPRVDRLHYLPYLIGLSIAETLDLWNLRCELKWPNDVLADGKKIAGVLIQTAVEASNLQFALAGIGMNLNVKSFPGELQSIATSVAQSTGREVDREGFLASLLFQLEQRYGRISDISWEELTALVRARSSFLEGCDVQIDQNGKITTGLTAGLDSLGGLIVKTATGPQIFYAGEIQACRKK